MDRQGRHAWPFVLLGMGLGDLARPDFSLVPYQARHGPIRTGVLVRTVDRGTLPRTVGQTDAVDGGLLRCRDARMEALVREPGALLRRSSDAHRESDERLHRP